MTTIFENWLEIGETRLLLEVVGEVDSKDELEITFRVHDAQRKPIVDGERLTLSSNGSLALLGGTPHAADAFFHCVLIAVGAALAAQIYRAFADSRREKPGLGSHDRMKDVLDRLVTLVGKVQDDLIKALAVCLARP